MRPHADFDNPSQTLLTDPCFTLLSISQHISSVSIAMKDKMDLSMGIAVGSCTQISLFVVPLTVLVGWAVDKPMTLNFPHFEISL